MDGEVLSARLILTLGMAVAGLLAAFLAGRFMERDRVRMVRDQGAEILHNDIADMVDAALRASGWRMVHQAEQVDLALKRRLGGAFNLSNDIQKHAKAAAGVFRDKDGKKDHEAHKGHGAVYGPPSPANSGVIVVVNGSTGDASAGHGGGHDGGHGGDHGHGHGGHDGHEPGLEDRQLQVRKALEAFRKYWSDRGARIAEIKQAQRELAGEA